MRLSCRLLGFIVSGELIARDEGLLCDFATRLCCMIPEDKRLSELDPRSGLRIFCRALSGRRRSL